MVAAGGADLDGFQTASPTRLLIEEIRARACFSAKVIVPRYEALYRRLCR